MDIRNSSYSGLNIPYFLPSNQSIFPRCFRALHSIKMVNILINIFLVREQGLNESNINKNINFNCNSCAIS